MARLRVAAAQLNLVVGDLEGNAARILAAYERGRRGRLRPGRVPRARDHRVPARGPPAPPRVRRAGGRDPRQDRVPHRPPAPRSSASPRPTATSTTRPPSARTGKVLGIYRKHLLPNYAVFDEQRYFESWTVDGPLFVVGGVRVGHLDLRGRVEPERPAAHPGRGGAELVVNINASPYYAGRLRERETMLATRAADASVPVLYVNLVGGQDELVFDGASMLFDEGGHLVARAKQFDRGSLDLRRRRAPGVPPPRARSARSPAGATAPRGRGQRAAAPGAGPRRRASRSRDRPGARGLRGAGARHARLRPQERLHRRAHRPVGRHRLVAGRGDRGRRARARARRRRCSCRRASRASTA